MTGTSTASAEYELAKRALARAREKEWDDPGDPIAQRRGKFWERETAALAAMNGDEIIPLF